MGKGYSDIVENEYRMTVESAATLRVSWPGVSSRATTGSTRKAESASPSVRPSPDVALAGLPGVTTSSTSYQ
jgi:hypothetical protein